MTIRLSSQIEEAASYVRARTRTKPSIGVILGTGLGDFAAALEVEATIPFREIPHFPVSTVESHAGELVLGTLAGRPTAVLKGRVHYYEGYSMRQVAFPMRVLKALGCGTVVITNASGGLDPALALGTIAVITDHINLMGDNPLIGENEESLGPRFPDMSEPYDRGLLALAQRVAAEQGMRLPPAVFVAVAGPNLETAAEYRFLRKIGADVVGMSLVPENLAAVHGGQRVLALSVVTDACNPEALHPVSIPEILAVAAKTAPSLVRLISGVVARLDEAREPAAAAGR